MNICGWLPMIIQLHIGDFGFGRNICGFEASSLTMVLLYAPLWVHTLPLSPFPSQCLDSNNIKSFTTCMRSRSQTHQPFGLLKQLPVPEFPWNSISMDFIEKLPPSSGYDTILVIVDQLIKQSIFIPTVDNITAPMLAQLFVLHIFLKHGVPSHVTSDCGSEFVSSFFWMLGKALDMKLHFTSSYHPKGDGQTEQMNQTLEQYLQVYCNYQQDNWSDLLPIALPIIMPLMPPQESLCFSPTKDTIPASPQALTET